MSFRSSAPAPAWAARAAIAATGLVVLLAFLSAGTQGIGTSERDYWFSPTDQPWAQSMLPALDTPDAVPWSPSALMGRGAMAIARGRRTALRDLAAAASAAAIVLLGVWLTGTGAPIFPVLITMLGMTASPTFWGRGTYWTSDALSPALGLIAAWAASRWSMERRPMFAGAAGLAAVVAIAEDPSWVACLPAVAVFVWGRLPSRGQRVAAVAGVAALAACAVTPLLTRAAVARQALWAPLAGATPPGALTLWTQVIDVRMVSAGSLSADLSREFTPLGAMLLVIGLVVLWTIRRERRAVIVLAAGLTGWQWFVPHSSLEPISLPIAIFGWAAVAVALQWAQQTMTPRAAQALVVVMGILIIGQPALIRARMAALGKDDQSEEQVRMAYGFNVSDLPADAAIIAESRRVDAALLLSSQKAGVPALIVPQALDPLQSVIDRGRPVFAFSGARANLAPFGFLFERSWAGNTAVAAVAGRATCVTLTQGTWVDVSLLLANGSFIVHGAGPGTAPGGVSLRLGDAQPVHFASITPRSIRFELGAMPREGMGIREFDLAAARSGAERVMALRIRETGRRDPVTFTFIVPPQVAVATADGASPITMCPGVPRGDLTLGRNPAATAALPMTSAQAFGPGWHAAEADPDPFRWTAAPNSSIRVSVAPPGPIHVTITASPAAPPAQQPTIALAVNACMFPARPMPPGQSDYEWDVPSACWRAGANQIWTSVTPLVSPQSLTGSPDQRLLGARVGAVRLARMANSNAK